MLLGLRLFPSSDLVATDLLATGGAVEGGGLPALNFLSTGGGVEGEPVEYLWPLEPDATGAAGFDAGGVECVAPPLPVEYLLPFVPDATGAAGFDRGGE